MALDFNGSTQYLTAASGLGLTATGSFWVVCRVWLDAIPVANRTIFSVGVGGATANRRIVIASNSGGGTISIQSVNSGNTVTGPAGPSVSAGAWLTVVAEFGGNTFRAIAVNTEASRVTTTVSSILGTAPDQTRIATNHTAANFLDGKIAWVSVFSGAPTVDQRGAAFAAAHGRLISPATLIEAWDLAGVASPEPGQCGVTDLTLVAAPTAYPSPRIYEPRGRSLVSLAGTAPPATGNPWYAYAQSRA